MSVTAHFRFDVQNKKKGKRTLIINPPPLENNLLVDEPGSEDWWLVMALSQRH